MRACDAQWAKQWTKAVGQEPRYIPSISPSNLYEMGWRDALEWIRANTHNGFCYECGGFRDNAGELIDKELEAE